MSVPLKSQQELYDMFIQILFDQAPDLTDQLDGSIIDGLAGVFSVAGIELQRYIILQFNKTFIDLSNGPVNTGDPDDLQTLAVDHYGTAFERPPAVKAVDVATFSRPSGSVGPYGDVDIPAGTIVKTLPDANGKTQRYSTDSDVQLTNTNGGTGSDISIAVSVTAVVAGAAGSAQAGAISVIESSLLDPTIVTTNAGNATGADADDDSEYREFIRNKIEGLAGATKAAIEAAAKSVTGVVTATAIEAAITVIAYNPTTETMSGEWFTIPKASLYVADATGIASQALIDLVIAAIDPAIKACGAFINVFSATAQSVDWTATYALNPSGPHYSQLIASDDLILTAMKNYINGLPIGTSFVRSAANAAILALYGAAGSNDLTSFTTSVPTGDVTATPTTKMIAGTMETI